MNKKIIDSLSLDQNGDMVEKMDFKFMRQLYLRLLPITEVYESDDKKSFMQVFKMFFRCGSYNF